VDVRTPTEYSQEGHIPAAINIPYDIIAERIPSPDKAELIIVYCKDGVRSAKAKQALDSLGYTRVVDFGAITRWSWDLNKTQHPGGGCNCETNH
jgi:phage shock protein E